MVFKSGGTSEPNWTGVEEHFFSCVCSHGDHLLRVTHFIQEEGALDEEPQLYLTVHLVQRGFFRRLKKVFRYLFNTSDPAHVWGMWDEFLFDRTSAMRLVGLLARFAADRERWSRKTGMVFYGEEPLEDVIG